MRHFPSCQFEFAQTCAIAVECMHGYDVCPKCDPCTCDILLTGLEGER